MSKEHSGKGIKANVFFEQKAKEGIDIEKGKEVFQTLTITKLNISDLRGAKLRKELSLRRVRKTYHNIHKDRSGNFGFVLVTKKNEWFAVSGFHDRLGRISHLRYGSYSSLGTEFDLDSLTYENLLSALQAMFFRGE